jgi:hypothetical protein
MIPPRRVVSLLLASAAVAVSWRASVAWQRMDPEPKLQWQEITRRDLKLASLAVGHEYRQDDLPAIAAAPDGSVWVAWLSFSGDHDDLAIRRYHDGKWGDLHWVPNTSGDIWLPQIAVDAGNRPWVVWSQQLNGNWDLYARRFDAAEQEWGRLERLTSDPLPDINPRLTANRDGAFAVVWQGFRGKHSSIFLKTFDGQRWSQEVRVTRGEANDWEPAVSLDSQGSAWIAYDSYRNGNYDVLLSRVRNGRVDPEVTVAATPRFEARATVAVDGVDRVWVAWEEGLPNWGKDQGYVIKDRPAGGIPGRVPPSADPLLSERRLARACPPAAIGFRRGPRLAAACICFRKQSVGGGEDPQDHPVRASESGGLLFPQSTKRLLGILADAVGGRSLERSVRPSLEPGPVKHAHQRRIQRKRGFVDGVAHGRAHRRQLAPSAAPAGLCRASIRYPTL